MIELTIFSLGRDRISLDPEQVESVADNGDDNIDPRDVMNTCTKSLIRTKSGDMIGVFEPYDVVMEMIRWAKRPKVFVHSEIVLPKDSSAVLHG